MLSFPVGTPAPRLIPRWPRMSRASDAYLSSGDLVKNQTLLNIPLAISAQTVIYNLPGLSPGSHVKLNGTVLAGIYDGGITMWNDPAIAGINQGLHLPSGAFRASRSRWQRRSSATLPCSDAILAAESRRATAACSSS
jgi:hypothetical protein